MPQLNINISEEFQKDLEAFMEVRGIKTKSDAVKIAVKEATALAKRQRATEYTSWLGAGLKADTAVKPRFQSEDDLWKVG